MQNAAEPSACQRRAFTPNKEQPPACDNCSRKCLSAAALTPELLLQALKSSNAVTILNVRLPK